MTYMACLEAHATVGLLTTIVVRPLYGMPAAILSPLGRARRPLLPQNERESYMLAEVAVAVV